MDTIFDFMDPFEDFLIILNRNGFNLNDVKYFPAYREYLRLRSEGDTYHGSIDTVCEQFGLKKGTMRNKIRDFSKRLKK